MRRRIAVFLLLASSVAVFACKDDPDRPPASAGNGQATAGGGSGGSSTGRDGGDSDAGTDAATACNTLTNDGDVVDQNRIVGDPITGNGGQIADGTYELTSADLYVGAGGVPGPSGVTYRGVLRLTNGKLERVTDMTPNQGATPITSRTFGDLVAGGTSFTVTQSCPAPLQDIYTYTVQNNTLNIVSLITKESFTFTLR